MTIQTEISNDTLRLINLIRYSELGNPEYSDDTIISVCINDMVKRLKL